MMQLSFLPLSYMQVKHLKATREMNSLSDMLHFCYLGQILIIPSTPELKATKCSFVYGSST